MSNVQFQTMTFSQDDISVIRDMLSVVGNARADKRYSPTVLDDRKDSRRDIELLLWQPCNITVAWSGGFGVYVPPVQYGRIFIFKKGWLEPVPLGIWMGWPEEEWNISENEWSKMSMKDKAKLEAKEQVTKYVADEYYNSWLSTYAPDVADYIWWDEGGALTSSRGTPKQKSMLLEKYKRNTEMARLQLLQGMVPDHLDVAPNIVAEKRGRYIKRRKTTIGCHKQYHRKLDVGSTTIRRIT